MYFRNQEAREHIIDTLKNQSNIKLKKWKEVPEKISTLSVLP
jgi:hypothetical protein